MSDVFEMQLVPCHSEPQLLGYIKFYCLFTRPVKGLRDEVRLCDVRAAIADFELYEIEQKRPNAVGYNDADGAPFCRCGECTPGDVTCVSRD